MCPTVYLIVVKRKSPIIRLVTSNNFTGYYLVNYDPTNWQRLADYLNSDNYTKIHVLNRAQIIHDAYHLMMAQQLNISIFLDLASYLSRETDYAPWYSMFRIFEVLTTFFRIPGTESMKVNDNLYLPSKNIE